MPPAVRPRSGRRQIDRRQRLLLVSGGYTEDAYLRGLIRWCDNRSIDVTLKTKPVAPAQIVEYASRLVDRTHDEFDEVWCVVDVDEFDIDLCAARATELNVRLAVSNPCFELWLLLHFERHGAHLACCADAERQLRRHSPAYRKARPVFADFQKGVDNACDRARRLDRTEGLMPNPSSGMWRLVARIKGEG